MLVRIIPVGKPPHAILEAITAELKERAGVKANILVGSPVPKETWNQWRRQYNAEAMMSALGGSIVAKFIEKSTPALFVTDVDIYYNGLNFVFGLEDPTTASCIVSIARLRQEFYDKGPNNLLLSERAGKEAVHEVGHLIGMEHCRHAFCVMAFSPSVADVDSKKADFCGDCQVRARMRGVEL